MDGGMERSLLLDRDGAQTLFGVMAEADHRQHVIRENVGEGGSKNWNARLSFLRDINARILGDWVQPYGPWPENRSAPSAPTRRLLPLSTFTAHYVHITARGLRDLYTQAAPPPKEKKSKGKRKKRKRPLLPKNDDELWGQAFRIDETILKKKNTEGKYTSIKRDFCRL